MFNLLYLVFLLHLGDEDTPQRGLLEDKTAIEGP